MTKHNPLPPAELLWELFEYKPLTGELAWRITGRGITKGNEAGCLTSSGYKTIGIDNTIYHAHRIVWMWMSGEDPAELTIDHRNHNKSDNRVGNLRKATHQEQNRYQRNIIGASLRPSGKYKTQIRINGRLKYLGTYDTLEEASAVYHKKAQEIHGEFYCETDTDVA